MNVYDFDKTIYDGDSSLDFFFFCLKNQPKLIKYVPKQIKGWLLYVTGRCSQTEFKKSFFVFLKGIINIDFLVLGFWNINLFKIKSWYLQQISSDDVIVSASPLFLLSPVCQMLGISHLIASNVNKQTGRFLSANCYGKEKLRRFQREFQTQEIDTFYSGSLSDIHIANVAKRSFLVRGNKIKPFPL